MSTDPLSIIIVDHAHSFGRGLRNALSQRNVTAHVFDCYARSFLDRRKAFVSSASIFASSAHPHLRF